MKLRYLTSNYSYSNPFHMFEFPEQKMNKHFLISNSRINIDNVCIIIF